jgi:hypothetical protein
VALMPRAVPALVSFAGGEISPQLYARTDVDKYGQSVRSMLNFIARAQGAATRRPGTRYIAATRGNAASRLIGFEFSTVQAYIIEASSQGFFRFYMSGGQVLSGGLPYEIAHPYGADLAALQWVQSADVLYLAHPRFAPRKLSRTGHTSWTLTTISFTATPAEWTGSNWPSTVTFHDGRLWWGGTPAQPQTLWASKSGDFENLTTGAAADDALKLTLDSDQVNAARWLRSARALLVGTAGAEWVLQAGDSNGVITPSSARARRQTAEGSAPVPAAQVGVSTVFVQRAGRRLAEMAYSFDADGYVSGDLTLLANHVLRSGVVEMAWQPEPWRCLWCALGDGALAGLTYIRDQRVMAWHRHRLGGGGLVRSVASIPSATANELWVVAERAIGGTTRRYIERMEPEFWADSEADKPGAFFVDSGVTYSGAPATAISGLSHLDGMTVQILADGAAHPDRVVASGSVTLQRAASVVQVGLGYGSRLETLDIEAGAVDGTAATRRRRIAEVGVRLFQTLGGRVGFFDTEAGADVLEEVQFRTVAMPMGASPPLFSGDKVVLFPGGWSRECRVVVAQDQPLPMTVLGLVPRVTATE